MFVYHRTIFAEHESSLILLEKCIMAIDHTSKIHSFRDYFKWKKYDVTSGAPKFFLLNLVNCKQDDKEVLNKSHYNTKIVPHRLMKGEQLKYRWMLGMCLICKWISTVRSALKRRQIEIVSNLCIMILYSFRQYCHMCITFDPYSGNALKTASEYVTSHFLIYIFLEIYAPSMYGYICYENIQLLCTHSQYSCSA